MSVRRYEFLAGQHGYKVDRETCESIPGSETKPENVTAIDERDVQPLLDAARIAVADDRSKSPPAWVLNQLENALKAFSTQPEEEQGERTENPPKVPALVVVMALRLGLGRAGGSGVGFHSPWSETRLPQVGIALSKEAAMTLRASQLETLRAVDSLEIATAGLVADRLGVSSGAVRTRLATSPALVIWSARRRPARLQTSSASPSKDTRLSLREAGSEPVKRPARRIRGATSGSDRD